MRTDRNIGRRAGEERPDRPLLVFSAHFDDALLSAAGLINQRPDTTVVTVFGGRPPPGVPSHPWDQATGRAMACEAVDVHAQEDREALELVGARQQYLGFFDQPYRTSRRIHEDPNVSGPLENELVPHFGRLIDDIRPGQVMLPLGHPKWHPDHHATSEAASPPCMLGGGAIPSSTLTCPTDWLLLGSLGPAKRNFDSVVSVSMSIWPALTYPQP